MKENKTHKLISIKKKGFTLIELIAVIAIIIILSGILFPKVMGYVKEAKKLKVVNQCRKVIMASEAYELRYSKIDKGISISDLLNKNHIKNYLEENELKNINTSSTTIQDCYKIINGGDFDLYKDEVNDRELLDVSTIGCINSDDEKENG